MNRGAEIAIVGAGFAGLGMAIQLRRAGIDDFTILERAGDVGGIWRDNTYPGCACDIPSVLYSYSFARGDGWTRRFPRRDEIWNYLRDCARRYDVERHVAYGCELIEARYDEAQARWELRTAGGERLSPRWLILAMGALNRPAVPPIAGLERFAGAQFHSSQWDAAFDPRGKRVAVIGTGASAVQLVPEIAPLAGSLVLYQRTPPWILPRGDRAVGDLGRRAWRVPGIAGLMRALVFWSLELRALGFLGDRRLLAAGEKLALRFLEREIADPHLRRQLTPQYRLGCKRVLLSDDYYATLQRPNVELVTAPIARVRERAIVTEDGIERPADAVVFATGFRATEGLGSVRIFGKGGRELADAWREGMEAYLGSTATGFPNLFMLIGPNTGLGHNSMILMMEAQYRYVLCALRSLRRRGAREFDVLAGAQAAYNERLQRRLKRTVWSSGCSSWYLDRSGKNTTLWPGFTLSFRRATRRFDEKNYTLSS
ncbi:MAG TPA: NAD(P)/FAD-dependent oxidoreductase [Verrucomicrobiae bacterium]|nr:NAD(P)/FAD-dependent oxidoreductase [Verrucomicrobiae bacterium]